MKFQILAIATLFAGTHAVSVGNAPVDNAVNQVEEIAKYPGEITSEFHSGAQHPRGPPVHQQVFLRE